MLIGAVTVMYTPIFWPLCTLVGWFAVSFWVAGRTGYAGCPEIGAIVSLFRRRPIATRCVPLDRCDATVADDR